MVHDDRPAPPVEKHVNLRDFPYLPIDVVKLRGSKLALGASPPRAFRAWILLCCAAWHQQPAGSLPDDDVELSHLANFGADLRGWKRVREGALYGWHVCSDGRLYHEVLAERVNAAWSTKRRQRARTSAATEARRSKATRRRASAIDKAADAVRDFEARTRGGE